MPDPLKRKVHMLLAPFDFTWPDRRVSVVRQTGLIELPVQIAEAAIAAGYADPVDMPKPKPLSRSTARRSTRKVQADETALTSEPDGMDRADLAGDGGTLGGLPDEASE